MYRDFFVGKPRPKAQDHGRAASSRQRHRKNDGNDEEEDDDDDFQEDGRDDFDDYVDGEGEDGGDDDDDDDDDDGEEDDDDDVGEATGDKLTLLGASSGKDADGKKKPRSAHEARTLRMAARIRELEEEIVAPKSWEMKGEVRSAERPENSLLEVTAQAERARKPAPLATEEFTSSLEEMIIKRIRDERFDDVVPRAREEADLTAADRGDAPELSQEKSRVGLGDIYAEEFLAKATSGATGAKAAQDAALREELKELYHKVCRQLDGLSHFHFAPKPVVSEARVHGVSGPEAALPSLSLEDVLPTTENFAAAAASVAAPEEIRDRKRGRAAALLADEELSRDDRRRLRRAAKATTQRQNQERLAAERQMAASGDTSAAAVAARRRVEEHQTDDMLRSDKRVKSAEGGTGGKRKRGRGDDDGRDGDGDGGQDAQSYAKSAAFFANLQRSAQDAITGVKGSGKGKGKKDGGGGPKKGTAAFKL